MKLNDFLSMKGHGSSSVLAKHLGVSIQSLSSWRRGGQIPAEKAIQIYFATNGEVGLHEMRPDIFPPGFKIVPGSIYKDEIDV